jgi:predicted transcriptional regulator
VDDIKEFIKKITDAGGKILGEPIVNVAEGHHKTQSEIAKAAGITEVTVRARSGRMNSL